MKKKTLRILIITIILILCIGIFRTAFVYFVKAYTKVHFGDEYNEILYPTALDDYFIAKEVLKDVDKALSTITDFESAVEKFGVLGYLCVTDENAVREEHNLHFISANFSENTGYIWAEYSTKAYDKNGKLESGAILVLFKLKLEKIENEWCVTSINEQL